VLPFLLLKVYPQILSHRDRMALKCGVGTSEPEVLGDDEFDVEHGDEGEELDDHAIQALLDGINDADATVEEDAIEQFDDFVAEVLAASIAGYFDGLYEQGGSY
jgi:hypothetical protein